MRGIVEFLHPIAVLEDFARLRPIRWTNNPILLHEVNQARGAAVADAQAALQRGSGSAARVADYANRILVESIVNIFATLGIAISFAFRLAVLVLRRREELFLVCRL